MSTVEKSIRLYAWKTNYQTFQIVQGEADSRTFNIQLFSTTMPVDLTNCSVKLFAVKPDSTKVYVDCTVVNAEDGIVSVTLNEQIGVIAGTVDCWIQVIGEGGTDLRFEGMNIEVSECVIEQSLESNDDMKAFLQESAKLAAVETELKNARMGSGSLQAKQQAQDSALQTQKTRIDNLIATGTAQNQELGKVILTTPRGVKYQDYNSMETSAYNSLFDGVSITDTNFVQPTANLGKANFKKPGLYNLSFYGQISRAGSLPGGSMLISLMKYTSLEDAEGTVLASRYFSFEASTSITHMFNVDFTFAVSESTYIGISVQNLQDEDEKGNIKFGAGACQLTVLDWKGKQSADLAELHDLRVGLDGTQYSTAKQALDSDTNKNIDAINVLNSVISNTLRVHDIHNKYLTLTGIFVNHNNLHCKYTDIFPVLSGQVLSYKGFSESNAAGCIWYDANFNILSVEQVNSKLKFVEYEVPETACYARCSSIQYDAQDAKGVYFDIRLTESDTIELNNSTLFLQDCVKNNNKNIHMLKAQINTFDEIPFMVSSDLTTGYVNSSGKIILDTGKISDYLPIDCDYLITTNKQYASRIGYLYDEYKNPIGSLDELLGFDNTDSATLVTAENILVDKDYLLAVYPDAKYIIISVLKNMSAFKINKILVKDVANYIDGKFNEEELKQHSDNILYGKKYVACGDSFTEGDFSGYTDENGLSGKNSPVIYDTSRKMYKTYPWWIAERNNMTLINEAKCGTTITNAFDGQKNPFSVTRYKSVPTDADYITLMFGLNETGLTDEQIGSKTDTSNATLWGAYNIVFEYFLTNMPLAKIGVIIADAWMNEKYANAVKEICKYWGIPVLDLKFDTSITAGISGRTGMGSKAISLRNNVFKLANNHPTVEGHKFRSTIIENWLRTL